MKYVGQAVAGARNAKLVSGRGKFAADVDLPELCWMAVVRSPYAHARIVSVDAKQADALPGVICVVLGEEVAKSTRPTNTVGDPTGRPGQKRLQLFALPTEHVPFVGYPVAAVLAESRYTAHEAAELVQVEYEELPVVTDPEEALRSDAPPIVPGWPDNIVYETRFETGDVEGALRAAHGVVRGRVKKQRYLPVPIEPRAYTAHYDASDERLTVWSSTQMPHPTRSSLARALDLSDHSVRVIQPEVGGAFGTKSPGTSEELLVAYLTRKIGRPVRWVEERSEYFLACGHARETLFEFEAGYTKEGQIAGLRVCIIGDVGWPTGAWVQNFVTSYCIPTAYKVADCRVKLTSVATNKCSWAGYRGFGKEAASFLMDRVLDRIADATGVDRAEVRLRNFIQPEEFPYSQVSGAMLDSGDYPGAMRRLLDLIDVEEFRAEQARARANGRHLGLGFGFELTPEGCSMPHNTVLQGYDGATVRVLPSGEVTVLTGVTSPGSGNETGIAQIVADALGVALADVRVVQGDTDSCPYGLGNFSSRSLMIGGSAALLAAQELREKLLSVAGKALEVAPADLEAEDGQVFVTGAPSRSISIREVARLILTHAFGPEASDVEPGLESTRYFRIGNVYHQPEVQGRFSTYPTWPYMASAVVVEVEPETGFVKVLRFVGVHDCGKVVNPLLVDANLHGGIAQGLGGALYERLVYDEAGQLLTTTLMDYTLPTAVEMPAELALAHLETPSPATPLGTKGAGESGVTAPLGAVASAIEDALPELSLELMETPLTPERVWLAIQEATRSS